MALNRSPANMETEDGGGGGGGNLCYGLRFPKVGGDKKVLSCISLFRPGLE